VVKAAAEVIAGAERPSGAAQDDDLDLAVERRSAGSAWLVAVAALTRSGLEDFLGNGEGGNA
jgi:hypothetical protein